MRYASAELVQEHEGIVAGLDVLEEMARRLKDGGWVKKEDAADLVTFFVEFADKCHHGKEEGLLFPAMAEAGIPNENGPIGVMLKEHVEGRAAIARMRGALAGSGLDAAEFVAGAEAYLALLRVHIRKENMILFPLGDRTLAPETQEALLDAFARHEEQVMGPGVHERFHAMLDRLGRDYAKEG